MGRKTHTVVGKSMAFAAFSAGYAAIGMTPSGISAGRLTNVVKAYEFYRFTKLRFRWRPGSTTSIAFSLASPADFVASYVGEYPDAFPTYTGLLEFAPNCHFAPADYSSAIVQPVYPQTVPSEWATVSRDILQAAPVKWYRTASGAATDPDSVQGMVVLASSQGTSDIGTYVLEFEYTIQFAGQNVGGVASKPLVGRGSTGVLWATEVTKEEPECADDEKSSVMV